MEKNIFNGTASLLQKKTDHERLSPLGYSVLQSEQS